MLDSNKPDGYKPDEVVTLTQNSRYSMQCVVRATVPDCDITWTIDDDVKHDVSENQDDSRLVDTTSTTSFVPQRSHHLTSLQCEASISIPNMGDLPSPPLSMKVQLEVNGKYLLDIRLI